MDKIEWGLLFEWVAKREKKVLATMAGAGLAYERGQEGTRVGWHAKTVDPNGWRSRDELMNQRLPRGETRAGSQFRGNWTARTSLDNMVG